MTTAFEPVIIDAGTLEFSDADMTATGLLIPYGVQCRSNLGMFTFAAGDIEIPADVTGMSLNIEHKREHVAGSITKVWEQPEGVFAAFKYANTPRGREAYQAGKDGSRKHLSAEVANVRIRGGKALPGGVLFASAQVERPAFEGATLLAAEDTPSSSEREDPAASRSSRYVTSFTDDQGVKWRREEETNTTTTLTKVSDDDPTDDTENDDTENTTDKESTLNATADLEETMITVPSTFLGSAPGAPRDGRMKAGDIDLGVVFASIAAIKNRVPGAIQEAETLLAALADIKYDTAGGLTTAGSGILQPAWVGKLWQGRRYKQKFIDLGTRLYGGIQLGGRSGYTMTAAGELVQSWAGNKADIPTGGATTGTRKSTLRKYAWGADIAREWFDLEGGAEVIEELLKLVVDSYARVTDLDALADIFAAASRGDGAALSRRINPDSLPAGTPANSTYYPAVVQLIQAIEAVEDAGDTPTFALVNPFAWKQLVYTPKDLLPEFVQLTVSPGTEEAGVTVPNGKVQVKKAPQSAFVGLSATAPQVIAGAKGGIEFREHGTTPIQIDAIDIARGGVDRATVGYLETYQVRPESLVLVGTV